MAQLRAHAGQPCALEVVFYEKAAATPAGGDAERAPADLSRPLTRVVVKPEVLCRDHLEDLGFDVAHACPDLEGAELPVGIEYFDEHPLVPMLVAKKSCAPTWEDAELAAGAPMHIETLDRGPLAKLMAKKGLDPKNLVFRLKPVAVPDAPAPRPSRGFELKGRSDEPDAWVTVRVPRFVRWAETAVPPHTELLPSPVGDHWLPVSVPRTLLENLARDEAAYATRAGDAWTERAWFLAGNLGRQNGRINARVRALCPASDVRASAADVVFGAQTWVRARQEMDARGLELLGWVHTHSLARLRKLARRQTGGAVATAAIATPATAADGGAAPSDLHAALANLKSGLFLSQTDIDSARRLGFRSPTSLTAVLDADACAAIGESRVDDLGSLIAFWGWDYGFLARRSVRLITGAQS
jgi:hypothetical protein